MIMIITITIIIIFIIIIIIIILTMIKQVLFSKKIKIQKFAIRCAMKKMIIIIGNYNNNNNNKTIVGRLLQFLTISPHKTVSI